MVSLALVAALAAGAGAAQDAPAAGAGAQDVPAAGAAAGAAAKAPDAPAEAAPATSLTYAIGPTDVLRINVWRKRS